MSLNGSRLLSRIAVNPDCEIQVAMVICTDGSTNRSEKRFVEAVTGQPYMGEYGQRDSQRRRGNQFEKNLLNPPGDARLLKNTLAEISGTSVDNLSFTDIHDEVPGGKETMVKRLGRTREYLKAACSGGVFPNIIAHPIFLIPTKHGVKPYVFIEPDFIVWDSSKRMYIPGDAKSFVVRDGEMDRGNIEKCKLQLACQVVGLKHEIARFGMKDKVRNEGILVYATPYGLKPSTPVIEDLRGPIAMIEKAIDKFIKHRSKVISVAAGAPSYLVVDELQESFQESCISQCLMADVCKRRIQNTSIELGSSIQGIAGNEHALDRMTQLIFENATPANQKEEELKDNLQQVAVSLGLVKGAA